MSAGVHARTRRPAPPSAPPPAPRVVHVGVLVYPGCVRSAAVVPLDVFDLANRVQQARRAASRVHFDARWVGARPQAAVACDGVTFATTPTRVGGLQALVVPGLTHADAQRLDAELSPLGPELALLRSAAREAVPLLAGCSATCLLAHAGLLDGRRAATSWWLAGHCRRHYPAVQLQADEVLVQDGRFVTSAGLTSYFDLALWVVGEHAGADVRQQVARMLLLEGRASGQGPHAGAAAAGDGGPVVMERARRWLARHVDRPWTVQALAQHCHTSERTLLRRFREVLGLSPVQHMQQLRVERAKRLLESTLKSLDDIAALCGYQDAATLQRVFAKWTTLSPREYRRRFGLRR